MRKLIALCAALTFSNSAFAFDHAHTAWTVLLKKHVVAKGPVSQVDYLGFKKDAAAFNAYTHSLSDVTKAEFDGFTKPQKMAFLINAYNAFTIKIILQHYPVKSIKDIGSLFKNTWKIAFIKLFGEDLSLDQIEHENLRKNYDEPRVHFAVNCASVGCPALRAEAYTADKIGGQLDQQAKLFLRDTSRNRVDAPNRKLELSMIFKWFHEDFEKNGSTVQKFISRFITDDAKVQEMLSRNEFSVSYTDYDWTLNNTTFVW